MPKIRCDESLLLSVDLVDRRLAHYQALLSPVCVNQRRPAALLPNPRYSTETPSSRALYKRQTPGTVPLCRPCAPTTPQGSRFSVAYLPPSLPEYPNKGADDVDGIRLKTGRTTEAEAFDGLCDRQGDSSATAQPSDQSRESGRRLRDGSPPPSAASRAGCDSSR